MLVLLLVLLRLSVAQDVFRISASGSSQIGESCSSHSDCVSGATCSHGSCRCLPSYVPLDRFCWKKLSPGESGCSFDEQCDSSWPGSKCVQSSCRCPRGMKLSQTREGPVCHPPGECPTNGKYSMLFDRNTDKPSQCFFFDDERKAGNFIGCDDFPDLFECIDGLCCASRAFTCSQPIDAGFSPPNTDSHSVLRWFFDVDAQNCVQFHFAGIGGNANNFESEDHCRSSCADRCPRGSAQLSPEGRIVSCENGRKVCSTGYECTKSGGMAICCPSTELICSMNSGLSSSSSIGTSHISFSPGSNRAGQPSVTRWYWDNIGRVCRPFKYLGQGGNWNNFISEESCLSFCDRVVCPLGQPLRDPSGGILRCGNQSQCPSTHECNDGFCCLTSNTVCNLPMAKGISCSSAPSHRFWFDSSRGICLSFRFLGCHGNANSFLSMDHCQSSCSSVEKEPSCPRGSALRSVGGRFWSCGPESHQGACPNDYECLYDGRRFGCCPSKAKTCVSPASEGSSCLDGPSLRWFFDSTSSSCKTFQYLGCDGNSNNFISQKECQEYCAESECPFGGSPLTSEGHRIICTTDASCGSEDHFCWSIEKGPSICCLSKKAVCQRPLDSGLNCSMQMKRFYFDVSTSSCRPFTFSGCGGNENNFPSRAACSRICHCAACAASEILHEDASGEVFDCSTVSCPKGFLCVPDVWNPSRRVCCSAPSFGVCPAGHRALLGRDQQSPYSCSPGPSSSCPQGYSCLFNQQHNNFFCCSEEVPVTCPVGAKALRWSTGDVRGCVSSSSCEDPEATCSQPSMWRSGVCCVMPNGDCPPTFLLDKEATAARECSPFERDSCGETGASACLFSERMSRFVCCRRSGRPIVSVQKCPPGSLEEEHRVFCAPDKMCPPSHFCVRRDSDRVGLCCRHPNIGRQKITTTQIPQTEAYCPEGYSSLVDVHSSSTQQCSSKTPCPSPFSCIPSSHDFSIRVCCESHDAHRCSNGALPLSIDGRDYSCKIKSCPPGYSCDREICCPMDEFACGEMPFSGTSCEGDTRSITKFHFDRSSGVCRSFDYRGCNPGANTWIDEKSCESACVRLAFRCPPSFSDPMDAPQFCETHRPSCGRNEECLQVGEKAVCCAKRRKGEEPPNSLRSLMLNICGPNKTPAKGRDGDPRRCSRRQPCGWGESCLFSPILMIDICCAPSAADCDGCAPHILSSPLSSPSLYPGDSCETSSDCRGQSVCARGICICRPPQILFHRICVRRCPPHYRNVDGVCV